jgi:hypothetical protein
MRIFRGGTLEKPHFCPAKRLWKSRLRGSLAGLVQFRFDRDQLVNRDVLFDEVRLEVKTIGEQVLPHQHKLLRGRARRNFGHHGVTVLADPVRPDNLISRQSVGATQEHSERHVRVVDALRFGSPGPAAHGPDFVGSVGRHPDGCYFEFEGRVLSEGKE